MLFDMVSIVAMIVGLLGLWMVAVSRTPRSGERRPPRSRRDAPTGTGPVEGPRRYADAEHEHRDYGDEDPIEYTRCRKCGGRLFRARDGIRCHECGLLSGLMSAYVADEITQTGRRVLKNLHGIAPQSPRVKRRRDGITLGDEANAELLKNIFGEGGPQC